MCSAARGRTAASRRLYRVADKSFLAGMADGDPPRALMNARTGRVLASAVDVAGTSESRRRGLLGRDSLDPSAALVIAPCSAIHTFFMRFVIDAVFVDRAGRVLKVVQHLKPWHIAASFRAYAVIELNAGSVQRSDGVVAGDRVYLA